MDDAGVSVSFFPVVNAFLLSDHTRNGKPFLLLPSETVFLIRNPFLVLVTVATATSPSVVLG